MAGVIDGLGARIALKGRLILRRRGDFGQLRQRLDGDGLAGDRLLIERAGEVAEFARVSGGGIEAHKSGE